MQRPAPPDHYATIGVPPQTPHVALRAAYRQAIRTVHPDVAGDDPVAAARARALNAAWAVLRDPVARARYDRERATASAGASGADGPRGGADGDPGGGAQVSWGRDGVRPVTLAQLREAASRESAYSERGRQQRAALSAASWRMGLAVVAAGSALLALVALL